MILDFLYVLLLFFWFSYRLPSGLAGESLIHYAKGLPVTDMVSLEEETLRVDLARLLLAAVDLSGRPRCDIARDAQIHRDALRRILTAQKSASLGEALRILAASGVPPRAHLLLFLISDGDRPVDWLQTDLAQFFEEFSAEFPEALERILGNQVHDVKPRWAKGTANRVARLLSDHIVELERKDAFLGNFFAGEKEEAHG